MLKSFARCGVFAAALVAVLAQPAFAWYRHHAGYHHHDHAYRVHHHHYAYRQHRYAHHHRYAYRHRYGYHHRYAQHHRYAYRHDARRGGWFGNNEARPHGFAAPSVSSAPPASRESWGQHSSLDGMIAMHAAANGVPVSLVHRVIKRESGYNPHAVSAGNYGLMQIRLGTARSMGYTGSAQGLLDPSTNMTYAVRYLAGAYRAAGGNESRAVALYASGYGGRGAGTVRRSTPAVALYASGYGRGAGTVRRSTPYRPVAWSWLRNLWSYRPSHHSRRSI